jgi:hypothetical protein
MATLGSLVANLTLENANFLRLGRLGEFERQLAEGASADYRAVCHELLGFCRDVLNAQLNLLRASIAIGEQRQTTIDQIEQKLRRWAR